MKEPDKRLQGAIKIILAVWGIITGWTFAGFVTSLSGRLGYGTTLIVKLVNAVIFGVIFFTLSRPVAALTECVAAALKKRFTATPPAKIASVILGGAIGIMSGVLTAALVGVFTQNLPARVIVATVAAATGAYLGYLACDKWLSCRHEDELELIDYNGYVLTYGAFFVDKVVYISQLLNGRIYIAEKTLRRLIALSDSDESAKRALGNYLKLAEYCSVKLFGEGDARDEEDIILSVARAKALKILVGTQNELKTTDEVKVLSLSEL